MTDYHAMAMAERQAIYEDLTGLTDEQWATMTICDPWTVRHLVAHMTALGNQTRMNFFTGMLSTGFNFHKFVAKDLQRFDEGSNADVLARFQQTLDNTKPPPGPDYVSLGEYLCHGEDIRRAVGIQGAHPAEHLEALALLYAKTGAPIAGKKRVAGLRLRATDADVTIGDGPEVAGPGVELIRAMTGRVDALDHCEGDGVDTMRARC